MNEKSNILGGNIDIPKKTKEAIDKISVLRQNKREKTNALNTYEYKNYEFSPDMKFQEGLFSTLIEDVHFECFYKRKLGTKKLYVILGGGRWRPPGVLAKTPNFPRWSWNPILDGHLLCIEDPMYYKYPNLTVGWFYGTEDKNYREVTSRLINSIIKFEGINGKDVILYASSSGGAAAIHVGSFIKDCTVVSINPQIFPLNAKESKDFINNTGLNLLAPDSYNRNDLPNVMKKSIDVTFLIIENIASECDYEQQYVQLCETYDTLPKYGLNKIQDNIYGWTYDATGTPHPHTSYDYINIFPLIAQVANDIRFKEKYIEIQKLCLNINEIWNEHYLMKYDYQFLKDHRDVNYLEDISDMYRAGTLIEKNLDESIKWMELASNAIDNFDCIKLVDLLSARASRDDISRCMDILNKLIE